MFLSPEGWSGFFSSVHYLADRYEIVPIPVNARFHFGSRMLDSISYFLRAASLKFVSCVKAVLPAFHGFSYVLFRTY